MFWKSTKVKRRPVDRRFALHLALSLVGWWAFFRDDGLLENDVRSQKDCHGPEKRGWRARKGLRFSDLARESVIEVFSCSIVMLQSLP
jgi:hypothetical protein